VLGRRLHCVGLTGGVGTGKSSVSRVLREERGAVVVRGVRLSLVCVCACPPPTGHACTVQCRLGVQLGEGFRGKSALLRRSKPHPHTYTWHTHTWHTHTLSAPPQQQIDADVIAREVVEPGKPAHAAIVKAFGPGVLLPDGTLDREALGKQVFADPAKRRAINAATHSRIGVEILKVTDASAKVFIDFFCFLFPALSCLFVCEWGA
jgi:hypothetical protein